MQMEPASPLGAHGPMNRNFSRPFPSPRTASSLDNSGKPSSKRRDLFNRLPYSASLFNLSKRFDENAYLATNRSMVFTHATASAPPTAAAKGFSNKQAEVVPSKKGASRHWRGEMVRSTSPCGKEVITFSNPYGVVKQVRRVGTVMTTFSSAAWAEVPKNTLYLSLDLFRQIRPSKSRPFLYASKVKGMWRLGHGEDGEDENESEEEGSDPVIVPLTSLRPLLEFQQLIHLTLTGMIRSYQPLIWRVVWMQPFLRKLHLSMALEPLFNLETDQPNRPIDWAWTLNNGYRNDVSISEYLGHHGEGMLHEEFGEGEYLDCQAMKMAREQVEGRLPFNNDEFLPIEKLSLERFVVDGGSIGRWFDPARLREIEFKDGCIDAGMYLIPEMCHVRITAPTARPPPNYQTHFRLLHHHDVGRAVKTGEVKIVDMKNGRVVGRKETGSGSKESESSGQKEPPKLKAKMSQLMHGWTSKIKGAGGN